MLEPTGAHNSAANGIAERSIRADMSLCIGTGCAILVFCTESCSNVMQHAPSFANGDLKPRSFPQESS
jgi:hypothetical protein